MFLQLKAIFVLILGFHVASYDINTWLKKNKQHREELKQHEGASLHQAGTEALAHTHLREQKCQAGMQREEKKKPKHLVPAAEEGDRRKNVDLCA